APHQHPVAVAAAGEQPAVRAERHRHEPTRRALVRADQFPGVRVPDLHRLVPAGGRQEPAVRAEIDGRYAFRVPVERAQLHGHSKGVTTVNFSPDGRLLATASWDETVKVWDANTGELIRTHQGPPGGFVAVAFSPDGRLLAGGGNSDRVLVWG